MLGQGIVRVKYSRVGGAEHQWMVVVYQSADALVTSAGTYIDSYATESSAEQAAMRIQWAVSTAYAAGLDASEALQDAREAREQFYARNRAAAEARAAREAADNAAHEEAATAKATLVLEAEATASDIRDAIGVLRAQYLNALDRARRAEGILEATGGVDDDGVDAGFRAVVARAKAEEGVS